MERITTLTVLLGTSLTMAAQLPPQQEAPLAQHLLEVNAQWANEDLLHDPFTSFCHFNDESERIAKHLALVRDHLASNSPEGLSASAMQQRQDLLIDLGRYAERGIFPQNHVLPYRNPVFIDPLGTACAVGQLMIESGDRALADRISSSMNLAYVEDMHWPEIAAWSVDHGFTADELAWIQPAYAPQTIWSDLGGGVDSTVNAMLLTTQGDLIIAGSFTYASGNATQRIAIWDGVQFSALGNGLTGEVLALAEHNGIIYAGGTFQGGLTDMAMWQNGTWTYQNVFPGMTPRTNAFHMFNNELYAAGEASGFAGVIYEVKKLIGSAWTTVGTPLNNRVNAISAQDGRLVVAGEFDEIGQFGGTPCDHVAELVNGQWQQLGDGLPDPVNALHDRNGTLMAGGMLFDGTNTGFGLALFATGSTTWEAPAYSGGSAIANGPGQTSSVRAFGEFNGSVFLSGHFNVYGPNLNDGGSHIAQFLDGTQDVKGVAWISGENVNAVTAYSGQLVAAGSFTGANMSLVNNVASSDLSVGIQEEQAVASTISVSPVPTFGTLNVVRDGNGSAGSGFEVIDAQGRKVLELPAFTGTRTTWDLTALHAGAYRLQWTEGAALHSVAFIKQ